MHHVNDTHIELTLTLTVFFRRLNVRKCIKFIHSSILCNVEQLEGYKTTEWSPEKTLDPGHLLHQVRSKKIQIKM